MEIKEAELAGSEDEQELGLSAVSLAETEEPAEPEVASQPAEPEVFVEPEAEETVDNQLIIHSPTG